MAGAFALPGVSGREFAKGGEDFPLFASPPSAGLLHWLKCFCVCVCVSSYRLRAGKFAGDMECDDIFSNDDVRHTITIICHLDTEQRKETN